MRIECQKMSSAEVRQSICLLFFIIAASLFAYSECSDDFKKPAKPCQEGKIVPIAIDRNGKNLSFEAGNRDICNGGQWYPVETGSWYICKCKYDPRYTTPVRSR